MLSVVNEPDMTFLSPRNILSAEELTVPVIESDEDLSIGTPHGIGIDDL